MQVKEATPLVTRFDPPNVLVEGMKEGKATLTDKTADGFTVTDGANGKVVVTAKPFRYTVFSTVRSKVINLTC